MRSQMISPVEVPLRTCRTGNSQVPLFSRGKWLTAMGAEKLMTRSSLEFVRRKNTRRSRTCPLPGLFLYSECQLLAKFAVALEVPLAAHGLAAGREPF